MMQCRALILGPEAEPKPSGQAAGSAGGTAAAGAAAAPDWRAPNPNGHFGPSGAAETALSSPLFSGREAGAPDGEWTPDTG